MGFLPNITVKPDCDPKLFLNRLEGLANQSNLIQEVLRDINLAGSGMDILAFMPLDQNEHVAIIGQFILYSDKPSILSVEVRARAWMPDPPNYESYVKEAKRIAGGLIKAYNQSFNSRRRLTIQKKKQTEPTLPPGANGVFNKFVALANKSSLHPLDWKRFYDFARFCHAHRVMLYEDEIEWLLKKNGFSEKMARYIADIYTHCNRMLKTR
jgi:hypothetical protein